MVDADYSEVHRLRFSKAIADMDSDDDANRGAQAKDMLRKERAGDGDAD